MCYYFRAKNDKDEKEREHQLHFKAKDELKY